MTKHGICSAALETDEGEEWTVVGAVLSLFIYLPKDYRGKKTYSGNFNSTCDRKGKLL